MQKVYNVYYINTDGNDDCTQLNAENEEKLMELVSEMKEELEIEEVTGFDEVGVVRYYVSGLGYDANYCITDYERDFGDFDTQEEAYREFVKIQSMNSDAIFDGVNRCVSYIKIQLEECEETDEGIECIDVLNEFDVEREDTVYIPSSTNGDYSPSNPWDAPGMSVKDFI